VVALGAVALFGIVTVVWWVATGPAPGGHAASTEPVPARPAPLEPPEKLRTDFGLTVAMLGARPGGGDPVELQPDADGVLRLWEEDVVKFRITVARPAYVGVWTVNADGSIVQLFPNDNEKDKDHHFLQDEPRVVPVTNADAGVSGRVEWVWVQAATHRWDADKGEQEGPFLLFQTERQRDQWAQRRRGIRLSQEALAEAVLRYRVEPR
jgi:hypothetical protein